MIGDRLTSSALARLTGLAGGIAVGVGSLVLIGWALDIPVLKSVVPGWATMKANTALAFVLAGLALIWLRTEPVSRRQRFLGLASAALVCLNAALTLAEYLLDRDLGIDQLLFRETSVAAGMVIPGRPAPVTAFNFLLLGLALLLLDHLRLAWVVQFITFLVLALTLLVVLGYVYGVAALYRIGIFSSVAFHTAGAFLILGIGIFTARADRGVMPILTSPLLGGWLTRWLLPAAILVPALIGWLRVEGEHRSLYTPEFGVALFALANIIVFAALIGWSGLVLNRLDAQRGHALESLQTSEEQFRQLVEGVQDHAIYLLDTTGHVISWNRGAVRIKGYQAEEIVGQSFARFFLPEDVRHGKPEKALATAARQGKCEGEGWRLRKDGSRFWASTVLTALYDEHGQPRGFVKVTRDITERKRGEDKFRMAVESAPNGMVMINPEGRIVLVNGPAERMFGYQPGELLGQPVELLVPERFHAKHPEYRARFLAHPETRAMGVGRDLYGRRKDGSEFPVEIGLTPLEADEGVLVLSAIVDITERKRAEDKFRQAVESAPNAMVMIDSRGTILLVNSQTEKLFGYPRAELLGQPIELLVPERFRQAHPDFRQSFFANPAARPMGVGRDLYGRRKDGSEVPVEIGLTPIETPEGLLVLSAIVDITERKRGEDKFRLAVESAPNAMVMIDASGHILLVNTQTEKLFGYPRAELLGQPIELLVPERFRQAHPNFRQSFFANPAARFMGVGRDLFGRRKDGSEVPVEIGLNPIATPEGLVVLSAIVDITERKRTEETLTRQAHDLEQSVRLLDLANILVRDMEDRIIRWNTGAERLYGFSRQEALQQVSHQLLQTQFPSPLKQIIDTVRTTGRWAGELSHIRKDGTTIVVTSEWLLHTLLDGSATVILEVNSDITQRKQAEEQVQRLNRELDQRVVERTTELEVANKELEAFAYSVSHDLRAPLRAINGFSSILVKDYTADLPAGVRDYLNEIRTGAQEMGKLLDDLLAFSRLGRQPLKKETVDTVRLVHVCLEVLRGEREGRSVEIKLGDLPVCQADPALLKQVWLNLLGNAFKYSSKRNPAVIEIGCTTIATDECTYFVKDNGVGFDMRYAHNLFGVFQRLHRSEDYEGTGVGLAIVQRIVHRHGGRIWAEAAPDRGAAFYFTLA